MEERKRFKYRKVPESDKITQIDKRYKVVDDCLEESEEIPQTSIELDSSVKLGVVVYKFPAKSNTFVVNELIALIEKGVDVHIYSVSPPDAEDVQAFTNKLHYFKGRITYITRDGLFKWGEFLNYEIPLGSNPVRKKWDKYDPLETQEREEFAIRRSKLAIEKLTTDMKARGIEKLYAPFGNLGAEICLMASKALKIPFFFTCHSQDLFYMDGYGQHKMDNAEKIFCISQYNKDYIISKYNTDPEKIVVKRVNYIHPEEIVPNNIDHPYIFGAGRLIPMKGFDLSIKAFHKISKQFPELHYYIAGSGVLEDSLQLLIEKLQLEGRVHLLGHIDNEEILSYINGSTFSILSSIMSEDNDMEGIPTFFIESMSCGVPCLGTNYSGIPELIIEGKTGWLLKLGNIRNISKYMKKLYKLMNSDNAESIRLNCKYAISEKFNNEKNTKIILDILEDN